MKVLEGAAVEPCTRTFDGKVWLHECKVFEEIIEREAPLEQCPYCARALPSLRATHLRLVRGASTRAIVRT